MRLRACRRQAHYATPLALHVSRHIRTGRIRLKHCRIETICFSSEASRFSFSRSSLVLYADGLFPPLTPKQVEQAKKLFAEFKANPKGPTSRSTGTARTEPCCRRPSEIHANRTAAATSTRNSARPPSLSPIGIWISARSSPASTTTGSSTPSATTGCRANWCWNSTSPQIDQGWIYRRSQSYRGSRQAEDEEKAGRKFLIQMLGDPDWVGRNYFLVNQLVAVDPARHVRIARCSSRARWRPPSPTTIPSSRLIRAKIHNQPGPEDLAAVEQYIADRKSEDPQLKELAELLRRIYTDHARRSASPVFQKKLAATPVAAALTAYAARDRYSRGSLRRIGALASPYCARRSPAGDAKTKLDMLDLNAVVLEQAFRSGQKPLGCAVAQSSNWQDLLDYFGYAAGAGLLSLRQLEALRAEARRCWSGQREMPAGKYLQSIRYLERSAGWCRATAARDFGPVMRHYQPVEPQAGGLVDHLLRGSVALPLTARLELLVADASRAAGIRHSIFGDRSNRGVVALNPGVAIGRLGIIDSPDDKQTIDPARIYVIPQTLSDLEPMAGHPDARKRQRAVALATAGGQSGDSECRRCPRRCCRCCARIATRNCSSP